MKIVILVLLTAFAFTQKPDNEIDVVNQLLSDLKGTTQNEIKELTTDYDSARHFKTAIIDELSVSVAQQRGECNSRDNDVSEVGSNIDKTQDYIKWLLQRLEDNNKRVQKLEENRCDGNENYITGLKNNKITLRLVLFLKATVQNADEFNLSLVQKNQIAHNVIKFLAMSKDAKQAEMIELAEQVQDVINWNVRSRNQQEVGTGHVDNTRGQMQVADAPEVSQNKFATVKEELLAVLNQIEQELRTSIGKQQDLEIKSGLSLADYKVAVEIENNQLTYMVGQERKNLDDLRNQLITCQQASQTCKQRLEQIIGSLKITETVRELQSQTNLYNSQKKKLEEELDLFQDIYRIYATQVATTGQQFKERVDDHVNDSNFDDSASYTKRSASQYEDLSGSVADTIKAQAAQEVE